jgi:hypothetical protein
MTEKRKLTTYQSFLVIFRAATVVAQYVLFAFAVYAVIIDSAEYALVAVKASLLLSAVNYCWGHLARMTFRKEGSND